MEKVYDITWRKQINGETVSNDEKIFSIYEQHTDIIVKGQRKFSLVQDKPDKRQKAVWYWVVVLKGNPSDSTLYQSTINKISVIIKSYPW